MAPIVYFLCGLACLLCTVLLVRAHKIRAHSLLWWSAFCFAGLTIANWLLFVDLVILPGTMDLSTLRSGITLISLAALIYGLLQKTR